MFVNIGEPKLIAVEVKSMVKDQFKLLKAPLHEHRLRTNLYLRCLDDSELSGMVDTDRAIILYVSKAYGIKQKDGFSPFKEFFIYRSDVDTDPYVRKAIQLKFFRDSKVMPIGICPNSFGERPKECAVAKECFSGTYPGVA